MPSNFEVAKDTLNDFRRIQEYMILAKKENAMETYAKLKKRLSVFKSIT